MYRFRTPWILYPLTIVVSILATAALIYLTPLKHIAFIEPTVKDIPPTEFRAQYVADKEHFLFIDVRPPQMYNELHAEGSINIPLVDFYKQRKVFPRHGKEIVLICGGGAASGVAYSYLQHYGFFNIERIEGGIEAWKGAGLPTVSSPTTTPALTL